MIIGKAVPDEWYERNIGPNDFYAALALMNLRHPNFDKSSVNPEAVARIKPHCCLVLDEQVMLELLETDSIRDVFALFDIVLPDEIVRHIHDNAESHRQRACAAKWLEDSYDLVSNLRSKGKVVLKAAKVGLKVEENPYVQLLFDEFQIASERKTIFVVDDRFTSSYHRVGSDKRTSNIVTTYDLLSALYDDQVIDAATFYNTIDKMYSIGYSYFVPPAEYLFSRLSYAKINSEGILEEYDKLKNIRKSVAFAFSETQGVISNQSGTSNIPEFAGYFLELNQAFRECVNSIWKSDESDEWCIATSNWLMAFLGDHLSDTEKGNQDTEDMLVLKQTTLLALALGLSDNQKRVAYRRWLEPYMLASWRSNPTLVPKVAKSTLDYVDAFDFEDEHLTVEMIGVAKMLIVRFVLELPYLLRNEMLKSPRLAQYRKYISCNDELRISQLPDFFDCVDTIPVLDKAAILSGNVDAMEAATLFVLADLNKNTDVFINEFPINSVYGVEKSVNYLLARFFSELAWYFPPSKGKHLHELKRMLSILA